MQATITYLLTEQAQRAQMVATGQPVARKQTMTIEITAEDLPIMDVSDDGHPFLDFALVCADATKTMPHMARKWRAQVLGGDYCGALMPEFPEAPTPDYLRGEDESYWRGYLARITQSEKAIIDCIHHRKADLSVVREIIQECAGKARGSGLYDDSRLKALLAGTDGISTAIDQEVEALAQRSAAADADRRAAGERIADMIMADPDYRSFSGNSAYIPSDGRTICLPAPGHPRHQSINDELSRRSAADKSAAEAKEAAKTAYIAQWIGEMAPDGIRAQFNAQLLCRKVAITLIAESFFDSLGVPEAAEWDSCEDSGCPCRMTGIRCLPVEVYPAWASVAATLPKGHEVEFYSVRACADDEESAKEFHSVEIKAPCGPFTFKRTVRL